MTDRNEYFIERTRQRNRILDGFEGKYLKNLNAEYRLTLTLHREKLSDFWTKYSKDGAVSRSAALKPIKDTKTFKKYLIDQRAELDLVNDIVLQKRIDRALKRKYITREDKILLEMDIFNNKLAQYQAGQTTVTLTDEMKEMYLFSRYTLDSFLNGAGGEINQLAIDKALSNPWIGANYSDRIWRHKNDLSRKLRELMVRGQTQGLTNKQMAKELSRSMGVSYKNAVRLIRTEGTYIANQATEQLYKNLDIDYYEYISVDDERRSSICLSLDGNLYPMSKATAGVNLPPMHPNCRSSIAIAPNKEKIEIKPVKMSYKQWKLKNT